MGRAMGAGVKRLWGGASSRSEGPGGHTCLTTRSPACPGTLGLHPRPPAPAEQGARKEVQDTRAPLPRSGHSILNTRPDSPSRRSGGLGSSPPPEATGSSTSGGQPPHRSNEGASQPGTASVVHVGASRVTFWKACCHEGGFLHPHPGGFGSPGSPRVWRRCRPHPDSWTRRLSPGQNRKPREEACRAHPFLSPETGGGRREEGGVRDPRHLSRTTPHRGLQGSGNVSRGESREPRGSQTVRLDNPGMRPAGHSPRGGKRAAPNVRQAQRELWLGGVHSCTGRAAHSPSEDSTSSRSWVCGGY